MHGDPLTDRASAAAISSLGHYRTLLRPESFVSCMRLLGCSVGAYYGFRRATKWSSSVSVSRPRRGTSLPPVSHG